jgi:iron complex transport system ATP-binding protein
VVRGAATVLREVDLTVEAGQCVAIIGPNGAGKTSLLQALLGLIPRKSGTIHLNGKGIGQLTRRQIARAVSYLPQIHEGFSGFTVQDIVATGRYAHLTPLSPPGAADHEMIRTAMEQCGVAHLAQRTADTLSGGEQQKVWLAAAIAQDGAGLFLDEPTASLDPKHQVDLIRMIRAQSESGKTVVIVCHDLNLPTLLEARVVGFRSGEIVFDIPPRESAGLDRLRELFDTTFASASDGEDGRPLIGLRI